MFLRLAHLSRYEYSQPVSFAPHALHLRPRETPRQRLHDFALTITPEARLLATSDPFDNALEWAMFPPESRGSRLEFRSDLMVETLDANPFDFFLQSRALTFPFAYNDAERNALGPCLTPRADSPAPEVLHAWLARHLPAPPAETVAFLTALNTAVQRGLVYNRRDEEDIQSATQTLALGTGSCRDYAVFLIELCRLLGLAARFVSGYVYEPPAPAGSPVFSAAMHAWVEVYLPGAGWRGLDPTRGLLCDDGFIAVAHAALAETVNPIQGAFHGEPGTTSVLTTTLTIEKL